MMPILTNRNGESSRVNATTNHTVKSSTSTKSAAVNSFQSQQAKKAEEFSMGGSLDWDILMALSHDIFTVPLTYSSLDTPLLLPFAISLWCPSHLFARGILTLCAWTWKHWTLYLSPLIWCYTFTHMHRHMCEHTQTQNKYQTQPPPPPPPQQSNDVISCSCQKSEHRIKGNGMKKKKTPPVYQSHSLFTYLYICSMQENYIPFS